MLTEDDVRPRVRSYAFALAISEGRLNSEEWPEEGLLAVYRFTNRADPLYCVCGHTWGASRTVGQDIWTTGGKPSIPERLWLGRSPCTTHSFLILWVGDEYIAASRTMINEHS